MTLLFSLLTSSTAFADGWFAVSSDNFTLYSDASESETKALIEKFEVFRDTALALLRLPDEPEKQRLLIILYDKQRDFGRISPRDAAGFYYDSIFGPRMLMLSYRRSTDQQVLFHEYVHYLMRQRSAFNYPRWYAEGLASVLMSTEIGDSVLIGNPTAGGALVIIGSSRGSRFRSTVDSLVSDTDDNQGRFYATAWLLTHYVSLGNRVRRDQTTDYLRRYDAGEDPIKAFEASYGITTTAMDAELEAYAGRDNLSALRTARQPYAGSLSTRALGQDEALLLLADVAVEVDALEAAHHYFDEAGTDTDSPFRERLMARRSIAFIHEPKVAEGDELMGRLLEDGSEEPQVLGDIAHYAFDKFVEIKTGRWSGDAAAELDRAIGYGERAVEADPANLEAKYYLGLSYEAAGRLQNATDALLSGYGLSPSTRLNRALARVLIKGGQQELASYLLSRMVSASHADEWRSEVRAVVADLDDGKLSNDYALLAPPWEPIPDEE